MQWLNEPAVWKTDETGIMMQVESDTDFWRITRHEYIRDDAHFYYQNVTGDFRATVKIVGQYNALYDQAGLMVRADAANWMKCGIEYVEEQQLISAVITRDYSDWSMIPLSSSPPSIWIQVERIGTAIEFSYSMDGSDYQLARQGYLTDVPSLQVGVMGAAPRGSGFQLNFDSFTIQQ